MSKDEKLMFILDYMLDNDYIIPAEYDHWQDTDETISDDFKVNILQEVLEDILIKYKIKESE